MLLVALSPAGAFAHSALLGTTPQPGARLSSAPDRIELTFTEALNARLSTVKLIAVPGGRRIAARVAAASSRRLVLRPAASLPRGAYRVQWHTVSTEDGHALEGSYSFGVRVAAAGTEHVLEQSPLARDGWLRVLARAAMYAGVLMLAGLLGLEALLRRRGEPSWLVPEQLPPSDAVERARRRELLLRAQLGLYASAAAALSATLDAGDAAGGISIRGLRAYLLTNLAGLGRTAVVLLALLAGLLALRRPRLAAIPALLSLAGVAISGHASSASPRGLSVAEDWAHLAAASLWVGGIAVVAFVWRPVLRAGQGPLRIALARSVLPRFGRVALPAFLLAATTGAVNAVLQLGHPQALWQTAYGRVLLVKAALVAAIAAASYAQAIRLRPRLLAANPHPAATEERRHWRLLTSEPLLALGVVAAVALLVASPLPPRQLKDAGASGAQALTCERCPLATPQRAQLALADHAGSDLVAAWIKRSDGRLVGEVRVLGIDGKPVDHAFTVLGGSNRGCGPGCRRFSLPNSELLTVAVDQRGRRYLARIPTGWRHGRDAQARRLLLEAQRAMRRLRSVRETETVTSGPGSFARTQYRLVAPDRLAYQTDGGVRSIAIGSRQWNRPDPRLPWRAGSFGGGLPFRTRSWFRWTPYATRAYLLERRDRTALIALMDPGTPAWWRLRLDLRTLRVTGSRLITPGHFMRQRFFAFDRAMTIEPPPVRP